MLKNEMESYVRIGGRSLKNVTYPYMGVGGGSKISKNHPYVINEWSLTRTLIHNAFSYLHIHIILYYRPSKWCNNVKCVNHTMTSTRSKGGHGVGIGTHFTLIETT